MAVNAQSVYSALGLSSEDIESLAQIPENEISVETLPYLIMQLKAKRAEKAAAATDTDCSDKPEEEPKPANRDAETSEKRKEKRESPSPSSSSRPAPSHDQEHQGKGDGHRKTERASTGGRRDSRSRKSSRERQSGDGVASEENELDDKPTVFPHICTLCKTESNSSKVKDPKHTGVYHLINVIVVHLDHLATGHALQWVSFFHNELDGLVLCGKGKKSDRMKQKCTFGCDISALTMSQT